MERHPGYNPSWKPDLFLSITFGFGNFPYAAAKGNDICWDLLVGSIGQIVVAIVAYPVIRRSLSYYMERHSVHFDVYASIAFDKISQEALYTTICDLFKNLRPGEKVKTNVLSSFNWRFFGHTVVFLYILAFPTLVSVMPGYQVKFTPFVTLPDNQSLMNIADL